jgi:protein O-mannosyl-transferase
LKRQAEWAFAAKSTFQIGKIMAKRTTNRKRAPALAQAAASGTSAPLPTALSWQVVAQMAAIVLAALVIYWPALGGQWLWDDDLLVTANLRLRDLHGLFQIWFAAPINDYWPLTWTLLWIEWHLFGNAPFMYHAVSLALHVCSAFLLWRLLGRLGLRWGWLGGLLLVIHPLMVESVAWVAEIKNTLSLPLFLLSCDAWLDAEEGKRHAYGKSIAFYLAAMLAKSSTVMLPAVLLLYCWWKRRTVTRQEWLRMVPYVVIAATLGFITIYFQNPAYFQLKRHLMHPVDPGGPMTRVLRAGAIVYFYLGKFVLPAGLLPIYPRSTLDAPIWLLTLALPCLALLLLVLWLKRNSWSRTALFGLGFFFINILPVTGLVRMKYFEVSWVADHLAYLPAIGLIALAVAGVEKLAALSNRLLLPYGAAVLVLLLAALAWQSRADASLYTDQETLWTYGVQGNPDEELPNNMLGVALLHNGHFTAAIDAYERALKANPDDVEAYSNLGAIDIQTGQMDQANMYLRHALRIDPDFPDAHANLGSILLYQRQLPQALGEFQQALHDRPESPDMHFEIGVILQSTGHSAEAIQQFEQVLQLDPNYPHAREALAGAEQAIAPANP